MLPPTDQPPPAKSRASRPSRELQSSPGASRARARSPFQPGDLVWFAGTCCEVVSNRWPMVLVREWPGGLKITYTVPRRLAKNISRSFAASINEGPRHD